MSVTRKLKKIVYRDYLSTAPRIYRRFGALWLLRYRNYIDRKLILGELYEAAQLDHCARLLQEQNVSCLIDIGANFGLYSISLATRVPAIRKVVAFEPDRRNFNHLSANVFLNGMDGKIETHRMGLSDRRATLRFLANRGNSTGMSRIAETAPATTKPDLFEQTTIEVDTVDSLLSGIAGETVFLKIDVEGHEKAVLAGATQFLARNACLLQIEILSDAEATIAWLQETFGFACTHRIDSDFYFIKPCRSNGANV